MDALAQRDVRISELEAEKASLQREMRALEQEARVLRQQLEAMKRRLFGSPRCERVSDEQLSLALEELGEEKRLQEACEKEVAGYSRRRSGSDEPRSRLPEDVETVTVEIVPEEVQAEPEAFERVGEEVTEELDVRPMRFVLRRIVRPKFKRRKQPDAVPFLAPLPPRVVPGGLPSAGLIAWLIVAKYVDHLPLYRIEKALRERFRIDLPRQRMCDWIGYAVESWLCIIYRSIRSGLLSGDYLQIDETPIRYLDTERKGKSHSGYLWTFGRPEGDLCFDWRLGRGRAGADAIASSFEGLLQSDGYAVYDLASAGRPIVQLGCWAHARRGFYEAWKGGEQEAARYLLAIRQLYQVEAEAPDDQGERAEMRKSRSLPVLREIESMLRADADRFLAKSGMSRAIGYARNQWPKLIAYVDHGKARIDNNLTEQAIRPTKLGAKNWLFVGSPRAGHVAATIYTILECCRRHGVEPLSYLTDVLTRLPAMTNHQAEALVPKKWKPQD